MNLEENESFKDYINSINFIVPQDIPSDQEKNSYANLKYGNPNEIRKRNEDNDSGRDYSSLNLFSDTNKTSDNASDTLTNELKKEKNDKKEIKIKINNKSFVNNKTNNNNNKGNLKGEKQILNLDDIVTGKDTRTTVMIRNIPIKYTDQILTNALSEFNGKYDCLYMPYDYEKNGNKGYAFINFGKSITYIMFL